MTTEMTKAKGKLYQWFREKNLGKGSKKDHEAFLENLTMLYESGMGLVETLETLFKETTDAGMKQVIEKVKQDVQEGTPLWNSLEKTGIIPHQFITLVHIGEESGQLKKNLNAIILQQKKEREFHAKVRSAMLYPILVLIVTLGVGIGITWLILPRMSKVFTQLHLDLPLLTRGMIGLGDFLDTYGWIVIPVGLAVLSLGIYIVFFYSKTKHWGQSFLLHAPISKRLIQEMELARFGYIGGTLLQAGMPIEKVMEALERSTGFMSHKQFYHQLNEALGKGASFPQGFSQYKHTEKILPISVQQMINSAYYSGHLAQSLVQIGEKYEAKMEQTTKNIPILLEPILLVIIWLGVVMVALSVILPIYDLVGGFNTEGNF